MDDISNVINFDVNENHPILSSFKVSDNDIFNGSVERSTAESVAFVQTEKKVLTSVNNNLKNGKPDISFTVGEESPALATINSEENIASFSSEAIRPETESINSISLLNEISVSINNSNCISFNSEENNSKRGNAFENGIDAISANPCQEEISSGNVDFLPETLSNEDNIDNRKNLNDSTVQCKELSMFKMENIDSILTSVEELEHGKNNSCVVIPDLVDFSFREHGNSNGDLLGKLADIDSVPNQAEPFSNGFVDNSAIEIQENKPASISTNLFETENTDKSPTVNSLEQTALTDATENYTIDDPKNDDSPHSLYKNAGKKHLVINNTPLELEKPCKVTGEVFVVDSCELDISKNNENKEVNSGGQGFPGKEKVSQMPENTSVDESDEISPLKSEKVMLNISDKTIEKFCDISGNEECKELNNDEMAFQMPQNISNYEIGEVSPLQIEKMSFDMPDKTQEQFSDHDFEFKVPDVPSNIFRNPDVARKMQENILVSESDEQFVDAVQFFKDPNSFHFLENIRTSTVQSGSPVPRSSLYVNFDPLHSKFQNTLKQDNCSLITAAVQENKASEKCSPEIVKKHLVDIAARESLGNNILISFDSPKPTACVDSKTLVQTSTVPKMISEEEHLQKLKIHELESQETYLKKQKEMELQITKRDELLIIQRKIMEELNGISAKLFEEIRKGNEKIISLEAENEKLKEDLKTSSEDLQSVENTFTDFYKRYEQCKGMLKSFKDNEDQLKQTILDLEAKEKEQEQMYLLLKERTEEMLEKANVEMDNVKRSGEAQLTVLKAQLKKAEMKISSLESDNKQIKIENSQLGGICDDLMAKVSKS